MNALRKTVLPLGNAHECTAFPERSGPRRGCRPPGPGSAGAQAPVREAVMSAAMAFAVSESGPGSAKTARR